MTYGTRILSETFSILADKAFPLCPEIMTPFKGKKDVKLTKKQSDFNSHMNSKRQVSNCKSTLFKERDVRGEGVQKNFTANILVLSNMNGNLYVFLLDC